MPRTGKDLVSRLRKEGETALASQAAASFEQLAKGRTGHVIDFAKVEHDALAAMIIDERVKLLQESPLKLKPAPMWYYAEGF